MPFRHRLGGQRTQRILGHAQAHAFHREQLGVLLDHRVLRLGQDLHHLVFGQRIERGHHRQTADEFRDHAEAEQIFRLDVTHSFACAQRRPPTSSARAVEAHHLLTDALLHDLVQADERAAANEQNLLRVDLDVFLMRMLAAALRRNVARAAFENLQQRLLHAFAARRRG